MSVCSTIQEHSYVDRSPESRPRSFGVKIVPRWRAARHRNLNKLSTRIFAHSTLCSACSLSLNNIEHAEVCSGSFQSASSYTTQDGSQPLSLAKCSFSHLRDLPCDAPTLQRPACTLNKNGFNQTKCLNSTASNCLHWLDSICSLCQTT